MATILKKKVLIRIVCICLCLGILSILAVGVINLGVCLSAGKRILSPEDAAKLANVDCILVLGCFVKDDGTPSHMLEDRLKRGVELHQLGASEKLLMSGDHGRTSYDEVATMKTYAMDQGIPSEQIFMDHAGFSTYESMYRARDIFQAKKIIIVTQQYHLYRAVYIARQLGLDAYGVAADYRTYSGQLMRDVRELLARVKDFGVCIFKPEPTFLGEPVPIFGDGNITNDEKWNFA